MASLASPPNSTGPTSSQHNSCSGVLVLWRLRLRLAAASHFTDLLLALLLQAGYASATSFSEASDVGMCCTWNHHGTSFASCAQVRGEGGSQVCGAVLQLQSWSRSAAGSGAHHAGGQTCREGTAQHAMLCSSSSA